MDDKIYSPSKVSISDKSIILIILLFALRIAGEIIGFYYPNLPWLQMAYQVPTYGLSAMIIWIERNNPSEINFNGMALAIFLIFRTFLWLSFTSNIYSITSLVAFILIAIILSTKLSSSGYQNLFKITRRDLLWLIIAVAIGAGVGFIRSVSHLDLEKNYTYWYSLAVYFLAGLGNESIDEEPLFRGFIWGFLRRMGMSEPRIVVAQAAIFALAHFTYWTRPVSLIIIFVVFLLYGYLVRLSKTISTSMVAHAITNAVTRLYS